MYGPQLAPPQSGGAELFLELQPSGVNGVLRIHAEPPQNKDGRDLLQPAYQTGGLFSSLNISLSKSCVVHSLVFSKNKYLQRRSQERTLF